MDIKAFKAELNVKWPCILPYVSDEQYNCLTIVKVLCFTSSDTTSGTIFVQQNDYMCRREFKCCLECLE